MDQEKTITYDMAEARPIGIYAEVRQRPREDSIPELPSGKHEKPAAQTRMTAALLVCYLFLSSAFGFFGSYLYDQSQNGNGKESGFGPEVIYQSVERTASLTRAEGTALSVEETAAMVRQAVVEISTETTYNSWRYGQQIQPGAGSGVIITADGYIVTNYHVIAGVNNVSVRLNDGTVHPATVIGSDTDSDLAVLKIGATGLTPAIYGDSQLLQVGEAALAVGNPLGELGGTVTLGIISALDRELDVEGQMMTLLQTDAAISPGNSGGGLFNLHSELVGIINAKSMGSGIEGLGFAIPVNTAKPIIADLITHGYVRGRVSAGLEVVDIQTPREAMMYQVSSTGLYIVNARDGQLQNGDRIVALNDVVISDFASFKGAINQYQVGDTVAISVVRGNERITVNVVLSEMSPNR